MFCKYCGNRIKETDLICPHCGKEKAPMQAAVEFTKLLNTGEEMAIQDHGKETRRVPEVMQKSEGTREEDSIKPEPKTTERNQGPVRHRDKRQRKKGHVLKKWKGFLQSKKRYAGMIAPLVAILLVVCVMGQITSKIIDKCSDDVAGLMEQIEEQETRLGDMEDRLLVLENEQESVIDTGENAGLEAAGTEEPGMSGEER